MRVQPLRNVSSKTLLRQIRRLPVKERVLLAKETLKSVRQSTDDRIEKAVKELRKDYKKDKELTAFTALDIENFYEAR